MTHDRKIRIATGLGVAVLLPFLPTLLSAGVGADLSGRLGLAGGIGPGTFAVLYLAGVLTSLTPCVYPLIPITVGVFGARDGRHRGRSAGLSATYVLGIALTYSALGLFAALSGKAFGTALSSPWVAGAMAVFLFALSASMFGAFELSLPSSLAARLGSVAGAGFGHALAMGLVAGLVAAPCTGPVLAGVLAFVATQRSVGLGFWMLFSYAVGMGTLFFVIGVTSLKLPRSGPWMEAIKGVFGVALVAAGIGLLLPLLPKPHPLPLSTRPLLLASAALGAAAALAGALSLSFHAAPRERLQKGTALLLLGLAVGLRFGWMGEPRDARAAQARIAWLHDERAAIAQARATGRPVVVDFFAEWCAACKELDVHTWSDPAVAREVADRFVPLKVDATDETPEIERLTAKYAVPGLPTVLMFACKDAPPPPLPAGAQCAAPQDGPGRVIGFVAPPEMLERLRRVQQ